MQIPENMFNSVTCIIPLDDVQHVEKHWIGSKERLVDNYDGILIITKHTKWDVENDIWANNIYLARKEADLFLQKWFEYRKTH